MRVWFLALFLVPLLIAAAPMETNQLVDGVGQPLATDANPLVMRHSPTAPACAPVTATLTNVGDSVTIRCADTSAFKISVTQGATPLTGTLQAADADDNLPRALFKNGVGELDVSNVSLTGTAGITQYRGVGFDNFKITLTAATSGSATVTLYASRATSGVFLNNPVHNTEEAALRAGRAFTASSSVATVPAGQSLSFLLTNPSTNNLRLIVQSRILACDLATGSTALKYFGVSNPTVNLPATAATVTNRRTGGAVSVSTASFGVAATRPDTSPTTANPVGGILPTGGTTFQVPGLVTIEPGTSRGNWISNTGNQSVSCSINYQWVEEVTN